jgi:aryl-alcohol dehydrogenase-like predicted oxidoreductase
MIPKLTFGRTGHLSTRTLFGAAALASVTQEDADRTLDMLLEYGINHIDTAATYGHAEERIGPWMAQYRDQFFLATKVEERTYQTAWESIRRSLQRLQVDQVDLLQLHNMGDPDVWEVAMGPGGALHAVLEAQQQGLTRFIGITGHGVHIAALHLKALERVEFDAVLLPYNYPMMQNAQYATDFETLLQVCEQRQVAVQTIKSLARRLWGNIPQTRATWYQPLEEQTDIDTAVHWVLSRPSLFLNTVGDINVLPKVLEAASKYADQHPGDTEMQAMMDARRMSPMFV